MYTPTAMKLVSVWGRLVGDVGEDNMEKRILKKIESFGDVFKQKYLSEWTKEKLLDDWKFSLQFFYEHSFMRGRPDTLSIRFKDKTMEILKRTVFNDLNYNLEKLEEELIKAGVNNKGDRLMILDSIKFIKKIKDYNMTSYFINKLQKNEQEAYEELIKDIKYVGDKIATLYFRELCWLFDIKVKNYEFIFPIDTWVKQIINKLGILNEIFSSEKLKKIKESEVKKKAIDVCLKYNIDPIKFNAGAWYIGYHSFEILLKNLNKL